MIVPLVEGREPGEAVRAWVAACSSGEEAYSLAMLLTEEAERAGKPLDVKVFATDLADRTLAHARAGVYPGGIESELSPERLERFFARETEVYRVRPDLRERVVFAPQNILSDPPFSRLDFVACRNLLIYLEPEIQKRLLHLLHFGLRDGGALFLGSSETVGGVDGMFEVLDKKARIYRRVGPTRHGAIDFPLPNALADAETRSIRAAVAAPVRPRPTDGPPASVAELSRRALLDAHTPPAVTVDRDGHVVYYHGDVGPFLRMSGEPTRELLLLAREGVRGAVRAALQGAAAENARATVPDGWVERESGHRHRVAVTASPVLDPAAGDRPAAHFVVSFEDHGEMPVPWRDGSAGAPDGWDAEVRRLRAELQGTIEELQASNEELKASNEEVTSVNEELQSTNEELETSKEEMQSPNEELTTVNAQLRIKAEEYQGASSDLSSLLASTDIAVLFLDTTFRIRRFTPAARDLIDLIAGDVGRPLAALARKFDDPHLDADCRAVLERLVPAEREVAGADGRHYLRRVTPYRTTDNRIDGVVVTFVDITARKRAEDATRASEERYRRMLGVGGIGVLVFDAGGTLVDANDAFLGMSGYTREEVAGRRLTWRVMTPPEHVAESERQMEGLAATGRIGPYEKEYLRKDGTRAWMQFTGSALGDGTIVEYCVDLTDRKRAEEAPAAELEGTRRLQEVSGLLIEDETGEGLFEAILDAAVAVMHADFGSIQLRDPDGARLQLVAWRNFHPDSAAHWQTVTPASGTSCSAALAHGERSIVPDVFAPDTGLSAESLRHYWLSGIAAIQTTPLTGRDGRPVGMISTHWRTPHTPGEQELRLLDVLARQAADFFERRRARDELRASEERQAFLLRLSDALRRWPNPRRSRRRLRGSWASSSASTAPSTSSPRTASGRS